MRLFSCVCIQITTCDESRFDCDYNISIIPNHSEAKHVRCSSSNSNNYYNLIQESIQLFIIIFDTFAQMRIEIMTYYSVNFYLPMKWGFFMRSIADCQILTESTMVDRLACARSCQHSYYSSFIYLKIPMDYGQPQNTRCFFFVISCVSVKAFFSGCGHDIFLHGQAISIYRVGVGCLCYFIFRQWLDALQHAQIYNIYRLKEKFSHQKRLRTIPPITIYLCKKFVAMMSDLFVGFCVDLFRSESVIVYSNQK